jgi:hypothetical protein
MFRSIYSTFSKDGPRPSSAIIYLVIGMGSCLTAGPSLGEGFYKMGFKTTTEIAFPIWIFYLSLVIGWTSDLIFRGDVRGISHLFGEDLAGNRKEDG